MKKQKQPLEPLFTEIEMNWLIDHDAKENPLPRTKSNDVCRYHLDYGGLDMNVSSRRDGNGKKTYFCTVFINNVSSALTEGATMIEAIQNQITQLSVINANLMKAVATARNAVKELNLKQMEKDYDITFVK